MRETGLEGRIKAFAEDHFSHEDLPKRLRKLGEEIGELGEAIARHAACPVMATELQVAREAADCGIILSHICSRVGYSFSERMSEELILKEIKYADNR